MKAAPDRVVLRCFAEKLQTGDWQAFCLNLNLAAQGKSFDDVKGRLDSMIQSYLEDAYGEDQEYQNELLNRPAPAKIWLRYWLVYAAAKLGKFQDSMELFKHSGYPDLHHQH